jgi:hypothetical protein
MVDVCFDDRGIVERRPEGNLMRANPGKRVRNPSLSIVRASSSVTLATWLIGTSEP